MSAPLYFGCWGDTGHSLWNTHARMVRELHPWGVGSSGLDGTLAPTDPPLRRGSLRRDEMDEGIAALIHKDDWTALAFWDRSVDRRGGSNSVFLLPGTLTFDEATRAAREAFPRVWERFSFEVRPCAEVPK